MSGKDLSLLGDSLLLSYTERATYRLQNDRDKDAPTTT